MELTYGEYGGRFVPETLIPALDELEAGWRQAQRGSRRSRQSWTTSAATTRAGRRRSRSRSASPPESGST